MPLSTQSHGALSALLPIDVVDCEESYPQDVYVVAEVLWSECRGEPLVGQLMVIDAIRNRSVKSNTSLEEATRTGMVRGKIDPKLVELVVEGMKKDVGHQFCHWINIELATDIRQVGIAKGAIRKGLATKIGNHWFY